MDPRVTELHCIMPMANIPSVMDRVVSLVLNWLQGDGVMLNFCRTFV